MKVHSSFGQLKYQGPHHNICCMLARWSKGQRHKEYGQYVFGSISLMLYGLLPE